MYNIFVYGTLKQGYNDGFMKGATEVLTGETIDKGLLLSSGHPFFIPEQYIDSDGLKILSNQIKYVGNVKGNIVIFESKVDYHNVIKKLDVYEGYPDYFTKQLVKVKGEDEKIYLCTTYIPSEDVRKDVFNLYNVNILIPNNENILEWK